jgi:hypothetical protein
VKPELAFTLLADFTAPVAPGEEDEALFRLYLHAIGGTVPKRTWRGRHSRFDELLVEEIEARFPADAALRVHDMAASNAITSLELFHRLSHRERLGFLATDISDAIHVVSPAAGGWRVVFDADKKPLQFIGRRMVLPADRPERKRYLVNRAIRQVLLATVLPRARRLLAAGQGSSIPLFHPECVALARADARFRLGRDDVLRPRPGRYDVIRIMGLLGFRRFTPEAISAAVQAVSRQLAPGGLLAIGGNCSRQGGPFNGTIYRRDGDRLRALRDLDGGDFRKGLILGIAL